MAIFDWDLQQGSADWYKARSGIPTASEFGSVMTPKQMKPSEARKGYACRLIAERLLNWQAASLDKITHIADGKENEGFAVIKMEEVFEIKTETVGFVRTNDKRFGASPDRVSGTNADKTAVDTVIEVKCPTIPKQFEYLLMGDDDAYRCQRQGQLWIAEADKAVFFSYNPRMPDYRVETGRDEPFIAKLVDCLERFSDELEKWTEQAIALGAYQVFAQMVTPMQAERGQHIRNAPLASDEELEELINGRISQTYAWGA